MEKVLDILTRLTFDANPEDLAEVNKYITKQTNLVKELENKIESLNAERKKSGLAVEDYKRINTELAKSKKALDNLNGSYKEQNGLIEKLTSKQRALQEQFRSAATVKEIKAINKELANVNREISSLSSSGGGIGSTMKNLALGFASGLSAVAALNAGVQFLNESFAEFEESEKITNRLKLSLSNFGKQKYFTDLINQADTLAKKIGYLDNDDIVNAQNKLVTFGKLSVNQIKALTPVIVDFAAKQQISIEDATDSIIVGLEGQGRAFRKIGISFKDGKTTAQNYQTVMTEVFDKVKGSALDYGNTVAGANAKFEQSIKDLEETTGRRLAPIKKLWLELKLLIISTLTGNLQEERASVISKQSGLVESETSFIQFQADKYAAAVKKGIITQKQADDAFAKYLANKEAQLTNSYNNAQANAGAFKAGSYEKASQAKAKLNSFNLAKQAFIKNPNDPGANELINPNADTELKDDTKAADAKKQLLDKIRAAEESTALRIIELNNQVKQQRVKGEEESIDKIKERIAIDRKGELDKLAFEITKNNKDGVNSPILSKNYGSLKAGINTKFDDQQAQEIKAFNEKNLAEIQKFDDAVVIAEIDLLKRKADLNQNAVDIQIQLIQKQADREISESNRKYDELIKEAKKYNKDYSDLIVQKSDSQKNIEAKAEADKIEAVQKLVIEQFKWMAQFRTGKEASHQTLGDLIGLSEQDIDKIARGIDATENLTEAILSGINDVLQAEIDKEQKLIDKQKERVDKATELAKKGNSAVLTAETDRLQKQEEAQRKRLRSQRAINAALVASQSAVNAAEAIGAVLGAAAEGDPYTIALRVVAAVAAIVGGVAATTAAVRAVNVTDTGFYDGDYTGDGNPRDVAGVVHKKEFVYTAKQTQAIGKENLRYIAKNELKPMMLKDGSMVLTKTGNIDYAGIQEGYMSSKTAAPTFETKKLESKIDSLTEVMSSIGIDISVDENGLAIRANRINIRNAKMRNL